MVIKNTKIFHSKALQNLPKLGLLVWKQTIWQPCLHSPLWTRWEPVAQRKSDEKNERKPNGMILGSIPSQGQKGVYPVYSPTQLIYY
jgi:hypothetical protein